MATDAFFFDPPQLETRHLILRKLTYDDIEDIFAYASDPEVGRLTTWEVHRTVDDSRAYLDRVMGWYAAGRGGPWGMVLPETGKIIGTCGFDIVPEHSRAEMGYAMGRSWWGQGLMTEAVVEIIHYGFAALGLNRVEAQCLPENIGSARVMEKAGMTYEGTLRQRYCIKGTLNDLKMYAILQSEWEALADRPGTR